MSKPDVLDQSALDRLREWGGDKLLGQMVKLFLENAPVRLKQIRDGLGNGDIAESEKGAHSLKSSSANVGAFQVRAAAAEMERVAGGGDAAAAQDILPTLESAFAEAIAALEAVEKGLST